MSRIQFLFFLFLNEQLQVCGPKTQSTLSLRWISYEAQKIL